MPITLPENPSTTAGTVGKDYLLHVNTGTSSTPVWTLVGGQRSADLNCDADEIDMSHKTSGGWKAKKAGLRGWSIDLGGLMLATDDGLAAIEYAFINGKEINVKLLYPSGAYKTGWGSITSFKLSTPHDGAAEISGTISGNGELVETAAA